jgi:hypothetical protein
MRLRQLCGDAKEVLFQSYLDLLKASWILYDVLGMRSVQSDRTRDLIGPLSIQNRILLQNLATVGTGRNIPFKNYTYNVPRPYTTTRRTLKASK